MEGALKKVKSQNVDSLLETIFYHAPIMQCLLCYLSPLAFWCLFLASPIFMRRCNISWQNFFENCLERSLYQATGCKKTTHIIAKHLKDGNGPYLTGGFLLAVLQGDEAVICDLNSDIDVVSEQNANIGTDELLSNQSFIQNDDGNYFAETELYSENNQYDLQVYVESIMNWTLIGNKTMQVLCTRNAVSLDDFLHHFDLNICANAYGHGRLILSQNPFLKIEAVDLDHLLCVKKQYALFCSMYPIIQLAEQTLVRILKYKKRGYRFSIILYSITSPRELMITLTQENKDRIARYNEDRVGQHLKDVLDLWHRYWDDKLMKLNYEKNRIRNAWVYTLVE